jgi:hypothetical protein
MKQITTMILCFLVGFYGIALFTDAPELLLFKSKVLFGGMLLVTVLNLIDYFKEDM